jgi:hypothetical protein
LLTLILAPELILLPVLAWQWGIRDAALFLAYSAVSVVYLAIELRLVEGVPFTRQAEAAGNPYMLIILMVGGLVVGGIAVALQYFLIFRSPEAVLAVTAALSIAAWLVTRSSVETFEVSIRFQLGLLSNESQGIYTEVNS